MTDEDLVGKTIGNYSVTGLLGRGGMGAVYLARNQRIDLEVAIKVLQDRVAAASSISERFQAEAAAIARLNHPNVIRIFDFGVTEGGQLYYVMEKLQGNELGKVLTAQGRLAPGAVLPILEQICAALHAAHEHGVVHRDLKPENIFITDDPPGQVKVLDFGIAKISALEVDGKEQHLTHTGMIMGTPLYIAPEQAAGRPEKICPQTDLYSLGVILYYLLRGKPPFTAESTAQLLTKHIAEPAPPLASVASWVPAPVAELVDRCLEKSPERRPISAMALAASFKAAVLDQDATATDPSAGLASHGVTDNPALAATAPLEPPATETPPERVSTTMQGATGQLVEGLAEEVMPDTQRVRRGGGGSMLWIGVLAAAVITGAVFMVARQQPDEDPGTPATGAASRAPAASPAAEPAPEPSPTEVVPAPDMGAAGIKKVVKTRRVKKPAAPSSPPDRGAPPAPAAPPPKPDAAPPPPAPAPAPAPAPVKPPVDAPPSAKAKPAVEDPPVAAPPAKKKDKRRWVIDPFAAEGKNP